MIDIHSHILPGVDDGSRDLEDSLIMADMAVQSGVQVMAVTPHSNQPGAFRNYESEELQDRYLSLKSALKRERIPLQLVRGMEIFGTEFLLENMKKGRLLSLNYSRYYLVEFPFNASPEYIEGILKDVLRYGKIPVIAHPERYYCVQDEPDYLYDWRRMGALAQMNKSSILGRFGPYAERTAEVILSHRMVNCIASDAHGIEKRTTDMNEIKRFLDRYYSEETRRRLLEINPAYILLNKELPKDKEPVPVERRKKLAVVGRKK